MKEERLYPPLHKKNEPDSRNGATYRRFTSSILRALFCKTFLFFYNNRKFSPLQLKCHSNDLEDALTLEGLREGKGGFSE